MSTTRMAFEQLPSVVISAVEERTGPVLKTESATEGRNSQVGARVHSESGVCFIKGLRSDHTWAWTQRREADVNPHIRKVAPALLWEVETDGWHLLSFEALEGHHADYSADSPDLPLVADALCRLGRIPCPDVELRRAEQRLAKYVNNTGDAEQFAGNSLLHTDMNNANVLIDGRASLVDWAWATRGAPWLDAAYWVIWLMAAGGHTAASAEHWARRIPAWHAAPGVAVNAFAQAHANLWEEIGGDEPDPWTARMVRASREWARHRSTARAMARQVR
ncbi:aminoglycoside phosphotransferase [Streptomyces radicis]|uniref:Aminoglycoside phosphotransferase n=1 Tax=Streptomyces radicis TaxID=1750517 RepID=A0A3A9WF63_9ACTN|nr:aminoglycoside phosphotransferase [Streptomyces radicis]RKN06306.1 aminoglycoside phosphotransferase [Streptomyces radicis]RKN18636.1 aminoglycoside phosphotransferase [Streptomyces radicis]